MRAELENRLQQGLAALGLTLPSATQTRLIDYVELLAHWNAHYNLTAVRAPGDMVTRHLLDSLSIAPFVVGDSLVDLGSGAGLPGIPLALAAPTRHVTLVDSNGKKARFLRAVVRELGLRNVRVAESRVEALPGPFDTVTARAFASLPDMLQWAGRLLAPDGIWLAMKGRFPDAEVAALPAGFRVSATHALRVPGVDAARHLLIIRREAGDKS